MWKANERSTISVELKVNGKRICEKLYFKCPNCGSIGFEILTEYKIIDGKLVEINGSVSALRCSFCEGIYSISDLVGEWQMSRSNKL